MGQPGAWPRQDIRLIVNQVQLHTIIGGIEVDYNDKNLVEQGFVFKRLGTGQMCGCGESFTQLGSNAALGWKVWNIIFILVKIERWELGVVRWKTFTNTLNDCLMKEIQTSSFLEAQSAHGGNRTWQKS